jgi:hypothetical protein
MVANQGYFHDSETQHRFEAGSFRQNSSPQPRVGVETAIENVESTVVRRLIAKEAGVRAFRPGQAFMRSAKFPKKRENGRENPAFCTFDFVSGLLVRRSCAIC